MRGPGTKADLCARAVRTHIEKLEQEVAEYASCTQPGMRSDTRHDANKWELLAYLRLQSGNVRGAREAAETADSLRIKAKEYQP
jgi:hypothetical protein